MASLPTIHADPPIEELPLPPLATGWTKPSNDAPLRIFRQGKRVFFTGMLVCGTNAGASVFASPLPEGWRPAGRQWFPIFSPKGTCLFHVSPGGEFQWASGGWELGRGSFLVMNAVAYIAK